MPGLFRPIPIKGCILLLNYFITGTLYGFNNFV